MSITVTGGPVARVTIAREKVRNALDTDHLASMASSVRGLGADGAVRVVVIEGKGAHFSSGADLKELMALGGVDEARAYFGAVADVMRAMMDCPKPVVAKVRGYCLAGAMGIVGAADMAYAAGDATFGLPEIGVGLFPMVVSALLARRVRMRHLTEFAMTGRPVAADEALEAGLLTAVTAPGELDGRVEAVTASLVKRLPEALRAGKAALRAAEALPLEQAVADLRERIAHLAMGSEAREAVAAFFARKERGRGNGV